MFAPQTTSRLIIHITEEQLGFLAHLFPNEDLEDALINLLERARRQAIRQAEKPYIRAKNPKKTKKEPQRNPLSRGMV
ncbi:hypothetical protein [Acaryochloris sp. IP29b_bin.137]|uniref:hypothetical protein n=1 Tax=Acaryochloris sp. IP29b_bin.137 TaxID=2969217 RepID=UPI0034508F50